ncbi:hypothetical protein [Lentilactobacillus parafarraginis]|uniref:hypothetical protein n=1 Tax=Lentilactobacillus parafarraginis TaxID=390842 RepID=UPI000B1E970B|nr:hypothetical protein [Lentilactobacillus parafarraginis]
MLKNEKMRHQFKTEVMSGHIVEMMVAPDALAAKISEAEGAQAIFSAGYATSASAWQCRTGELPTSASLWNAAGKSSTR